MWSKIHFGIPEFPLTISYTSFGHGNDGIRDANHESPRDIVAHRNHLPHRKFQAGPPRNRGSGGKGLLVPFSCHPKRRIPSGNQTWLENGAFTDDFPIQTSIYRGFSMAIHIVYIDCPLVISQKYGKIHHFQWVNEPFSIAMLNYQRVLKAVFAYPYVCVCVHVHSVQELLQNP